MSGLDSLPRSGGSRERRAAGRALPYQRFLVLQDGSHERRRRARGRTGHSTAGRSERQPRRARRPDASPMEHMSGPGPSGSVTVWRGASLAPSDCARNGTADWVSYQAADCCLFKWDDLLASGSGPGEGGLPKCPSAGERDQAQAFGPRGFEM